MPGGSERTRTPSLAIHDWQNWPLLAPTSGYSAAEQVGTCLCCCDLLFSRPTSDCKVSQSLCCFFPDKVAHDTHTITDCPLWGITISLRSIASTTHTYQEIMVSNLAMYKYISQKMYSPASRWPGWLEGLPRRDRGMICRQAKPEAPTTAEMTWQAILTTRALFWHSLHGPIRQVRWRHTYP